MLVKPARLLVICAAVVLAVAASWPAYAQAAASREIEEYSVEAVVPLDFVLSPDPLPLPEDILLAVLAGSLEIRVRDRYSSADKILNPQYYLVPAGTPLPLPEAPPATSPATIGILNTKVETVFFSDKPMPCVVLVGRVVSAPVGVPGIDIVGALNVSTFGYEEGTPTKFTISYDPDGDTITYSWKSTGRSAVLLMPNTATPSAQFLGGMGEYVFELTVTDSKGLSDTAKATVSYVGN